MYSPAREVPLVPGKVYELEIPLDPMAYRFRKGSRLRLEIANGDSAVTDGLFFHAYRPDKIGADTIHHDAAHPSRLILPVLDALGLAARGVEQLLRRERGEFRVSRGHVDPGLHLRRDQMLDVVGP